MSITEQIVNEINERKDTLAWWGENCEHYAQLVKEIKDADYEVKLTHTGLDIVGTGDKVKLVAAFRILRRHGFCPYRRPEAKETYYSAYFNHDTLKSIWFSFSSTVCQRVQVGTEMREVPVYEVQCGQSMAITDEDLG